MHGGVVLEDLASASARSLLREETPTMATESTSFKAGITLSFAIDDVLITAILIGSILLFCLNLYYSI